MVSISKVTMIKLIVVFSFLIICSVNVLSQTIFPMGLGPFIGIKANKDVIQFENGQNPIKFADIPDFGATLCVPLTQDKTIASNVDVGYFTYSLLYKPKINISDENTYIKKYSYFSVAPSLQYSYFLLGLNVGIPIRWSIRNSSKSVDFSSSYGEDMVTNYEFRVGGVFPIIQNEMGRLNVFVIGGYMLRKIDKDPPSGSSNNFSPQVASLLFGVNYLFTLK